MVEGTYFIVKKETHRDTKTPCVFSLSKKIFKTAVLRNKIKRQMRVIVKKTKKGVAPMLIIPKKEIINKPFKEIEKDLLSLLEKT
ncbi:MAG: ribonuclease P protein component [Candidatus Paceibacterota bacterium]|jgi:ribonuclease P protein component